MRVHIDSLKPYLGDLPEAWRDFEMPPNDSHSEDSGSEPDTNSSEADHSDEVGSPTPETEPEDSDAPIAQRRGRRRVKPPQLLDL